MRAALVVILLVGTVPAVVGCAPSRRPGDVIDAGSSADASVPDAPDASTPRKFGEPCTDGSQCESAACILVGTSGVCTQVCGTCPDGYGCFGVVGAIDPGQVAFVCVPISSQLCSPCEADSECTLLGMDKCVVEPTGRRYCGRDCSTVSCPDGYACTNEVIDSVNYKQCVPESSACDCMTADQAGATDACLIATPAPFGTMCPGSRACTGPAGTSPGGWTACQPPSQTDDPDASYADTNCDGIDGDVTRGIFVSAGGNDDNPACGVAAGTACKSISRGIARAAAVGRPNVYIQAGDYNEVVALQSGINLWGGYDLMWQRGPYAEASHRVTITGKRDTGPGGEDEWLTIRAHDLSAPVTIADLVVRGPDAQGLGGGVLDGRSSYAIHASAAPITLARVQIIAGSGAPGATGTTGIGWSTPDATTEMMGGRGADGDRTGQICDDTTRSKGGKAGTNGACGNGTLSGGTGGDGGTKDTNCPIETSASSGKPGSDAVTTWPPTNFGFHGGAGTQCAAGGGAGDGSGGVNGGGGTRRIGGYLGGVDGKYWYAAGGNAGGTGSDGTGGGGGGGAGGCDDGTDSRGPGGGGGGAGGCAAISAGGGGGGGGGSFGIAAFGGAAITLDSCLLLRGAAGNGGAGGTGGRGQSGGAAGDVGVHPGTGTAGRGGAGRHGGHGGGGGGGLGGRSIGILIRPGVTINGACTQSQGAAGSGGAGGISAPGAPAAERDGQTGENGSAGTVDDLRVCTDPANC